MIINVLNVKLPIFSYNKCNIIMIIYYLRSHRNIIDIIQAKKITLP